MSVLRSIPASMAGAAVASVDHRLDQIAADCGAASCLPSAAAVPGASVTRRGDRRFIYTAV
jgi:hypothetical protein